MTILNNRGIVQIDEFRTLLTPGTPMSRGRDVPYENPLLPQVSTITFTADTDVSDEIVENQVFTTTITDPDGVQFVATYTVDAADDAAADDATGLSLMAQRVAESVNALAGLTNVLTATFSTDGGGAPGVVTLTWLHADRGVYTVAHVITPAVAEQTLLNAIATPQDAGGVTLPMARVVSIGTALGSPNLKRRAVLPADGSTLAGVALRDITQQRGTSSLLAAPDLYQPGSMVSVREQGSVAMVNRDAAQAEPFDAVHVVVDASITPAAALGEVRASRAGVAQVTTATPTVANDTTYRLLVSIPEQDGEPAMDRTFEILSDGTATATEICDAFRTAMAADAAFTARIVATGAATLILTSQEPGLTFTVLDVQEGAGDWTSIVETTAAVAHANLFPRARWDEPTAAGATGVIHLNT